MPNADPGRVPGARHGHGAARGRISITAGCPRVRRLTPLRRRGAGAGEHGGIAREPLRRHEPAVSGERRTVADTTVVWLSGSQRACPTVSVARSLRPWDRPLLRAPKAHAPDSGPRLDRASGADGVVRWRDRQPDTSGRSRPCCGSVHPAGRPAARQPRPATRPHRPSARSRACASQTPPRLSRTRRPWGADRGTRLRRRRRDARPAPGQQSRPPWWNTPAPPSSAPET